MDIENINKEKDITYQRADENQYQESKMENKIKQHKTAHLENNKSKIYIRDKPNKWATTN